MILFLNFYKHVSQYVTYSEPVRDRFHTCRDVVLNRYSTHFDLPFKAGSFMTLSLLIYMGIFQSKPSKIIHLNLFRENKLVERAKALKVNAGTEPDADLGPVISKQVSVLFRNFCIFYTSFIKFGTLNFNSLLL